MASSICFHGLCKCSEDSEVLTARTIFRPRGFIGHSSKVKSSPNGLDTWMAGDANPMQKKMSDPCRAPAGHLEMKDLLCLSRTVNSPIVRAGTRIDPSVEAVEQVLAEVGLWPQTRFYAERRAQSESKDISKILEGHRAQIFRELLRY